MVLKDYFDTTLAAARAGAAWAWESIYRDMAGGLAGFFRGRGVNEVEDLVSETFLSVARDIHRFTGSESDFRAWVFTIAHRRLVDDWRARGRSVPIAESEFAETEAERRWFGDVEREAMTAMSLIEVNALIKHLTKQQRDVVLLRVVGDLSVAETAKVLETSEGAVRALQKRAFSDLRSLISQAASRFRDEER